MAQISGCVLPELTVRDQVLTSPCVPTTPLQVLGGVQGLGDHPEDQQLGRDDRLYLPHLHRTHGPRANQAQDVPGACGCSIC